MMAKVPKHIKYSLAAIVVFLCSVTNLLAVDPKTTDGDELKKEKKEVVDKDKVLSDAEKVVKADSDKIKNVEKVLTKPKQQKTEKVKKSTSQSSLVSYNFVFYLMYKFKIADIFDISKKKNSLAFPSNSNINYKEMGIEMIKKLIDKVNRQG